MSALWADLFFEEHMIWEISQILLYLESDLMDNLEPNFMYESFES